MKNFYCQGQGIIEAVFAVGLLGLILTGAVVAVVTSLSNRNINFDRRKAVELGNLVTEQLISQSKDAADTFWQLAPTTNQKWSEGYDNYVYSIGFTNIANDVRYPNCGVGKTDCTEANINIVWQGENSQSVNFSRFFSKYDN